MNPFSNIPCSEWVERTGMFKEPNRIILQAVKPLTSLVLIRYLHQQHLTHAIVYHYLREVTFEWNGKTFHAIGFRNDQSGYELVHEYFKFSIAPKTVTTFDRKAGQVAVFEDFLNFLSFLQILPFSVRCSLNFLVLNSLSLFEKARPFLKQQEVIHLYLNRDKASQDVINYALRLSDQYSNESTVYGHYKDLLDWLMHFGKTKKPPPKNSIASFTPPLYTL